MMSKPCPENPELSALVRRSIEAFERLSPEEKRAHRRAQAISFVYGNLMESPHITREMVEKAYDDR